MARKNAQNYKRPIDFRLRLTEDMHAWLKQRSTENLRSMISEINLHLETARKTIEEQERQRVTANQ